MTSSTHRRSTGAPPRLTAASRCIGVHACRHRHRRRQALAILAGVVCWAAALGDVAARPEPAQETAAAQSVRDGVYTEPQASRGLRHYTQSCERCHGSDLTGNAVDEVPALIADTFTFHFGGRTLQTLYDRIRKGMPADMPGSLDPAAYLDIVAYLLEANGFPRGSQELDRSRLDAIVIEKAPAR